MVFYLELGNFMKIINFLLVFYIKSLIFLHFGDQNELYLVILTLGKIYKIPNFFSIYFMIVLRVFKVESLTFFIEFKLVLTFFVLL